MEVINNFFKKEPNLSFVTAKIQQNCTDTGNDNSEAARQRINCGFDEKFLYCHMIVLNISPGTLEIRPNENY